MGAFQIVACVEDVHSSRRACPDVSRGRGVGATLAVALLSCGIIHVGDRKGDREGRPYKRVGER
jgi:hypothetical protein